MYVWIDALANYLTGSNWLVDWTDASDVAQCGLWPAAVQTLGKDIMRFHAVYWPAFLLGAGLPVADLLFVHGWWTKDGKKISKSLGNAFDPVETAETYGLDAFRYFLARESNASADGDYTDAAMASRLNSDLANDLGNIVCRVLSKNMCPGQCLPAFHAEVATEAELGLIESLNTLSALVDQKLVRLDTRSALVGVWDCIRAMNAFLQHAEPWKLEAGSPAHDNVLHLIFEGLRIVGTCLLPFMPTKAAELLDQLGVEPQLRHVPEAGLAVGHREAGSALGTDRTPLFAKYEPDGPAWKRQAAK
eukprot:gnl/Ergobibamus_cyprinoides/626.p2 GENE.gnl/Ergobibamus_cyprinoides/626~~gnl/Ergobibamus_cyprinoides/626.p2  ORF type:complete len:304 (+),score=94.30 gnl/Ergobibamus_cyprinoides/626:426-1337(+)